MLTGKARVLLAVVVATGIAGCSAMTGRTAGRTFDDATITATVKSKLATDRARTLTSIDVDTVGGTVYLTGTVPDATAKERATLIANEVEGVRRVVNNLQTRSIAGDAPNTGLPRRQPGYDTDPDYRRDR